MLTEEKMNCMQGITYGGAPSIGKLIEEGAPPPNLTLTIESDKQSYC